MPPSRLRLPLEALKDIRGFEKCSSRFFIVRSRWNNLGHPRCAVMVGVKVDRRSSARHLLRRRATEYIRMRQEGRDIVITVLPAVKDLSRKAFFEELEKIL